MVETRYMPKLTDDEWAMKAIRGNWIRVDAEGRVLLNKLPDGERAKYHSRLDSVVHGKSMVSYRTPMSWNRKPRVLTMETARVVWLAEMGEIKPGFEVYKIHEDGSNALANLDLRPMKQHQNGKSNGNAPAPQPEPQPKPKPPESLTREERIDAFLALLREGYMQCDLETGETTTLRDLETGKPLPKPRPSVSDSLWVCYPGDTKRKGSMQRGWAVWLAAFGSMPPNTGVRSVERGKGWGIANLALGELRGTAVSKDLAFGRDWVREPVPTIEEKWDKAAESALPAPEPEVGSTGVCESAPPAAPQPTVTPAQLIGRLNAEFEGMLPYDDALDRPEAKESAAPVVLRPPLPPLMIHSCQTCECDVATFLAGDIRVGDTTAKLRHESNDARWLQFALDALEYIALTQDADERLRLAQAAEAHIRGRRP